MATRKREPESDGRVLQLFLAGATYKQIAAAVSMTEVEVHETVVRDLAGTGERRTVLNQRAAEVNQERTEALFRAHWGPALSGDHRSAELCRRILERQRDDMGSAKVEGDAVDEIAARRAARRAGGTTRAARARRPS